MSRPKAIVPIGEEDLFHRMMVFGNPGVGKTVFAASSPKTLILATNQSETISAAGMGSKADVWVCDSYDDIDEAWEYLRHEGHKTYDWVWLDNITLLQDQGMDQLMVEVVAKKATRNRWVPDQHEYLVSQNRIATTVRSFLKLPMNFGLTAHMMRTETDDGEILYLPMLQGGQGALSKKICSYMNIVGYMRVATNKEGKTQRQLLLEPRPMYLAKGRYPGMAAVLTDPTVPKLEAAIAAADPVGKPVRATARAGTRQSTTTKASAQ